MNDDLLDLVRDCVATVPVPEEARARSKERMLALLDESRSVEATRAPDLASRTSSTTYPPSRRHRRLRHARGPMLVTSHLKVVLTVAASVALLVAVVIVAAANRGHTAPAGTHHQPTAGWSAPQAIDKSAPLPASLSSVSCPTSTFCMAVDYSGNSLRWNGTSWSVPQKISQVLAAVSCPSASFCVAVGSSGGPLGPAAGYAVTWSGSSWSKPTSIDSSGGGPFSISCPSSSFCLVGDKKGNSITWDGSTWSAPEREDKRLPIIMDSISCLSTTFCMAVGISSNAKAYALSWNGAWSAPEGIGGIGQLTSVSCASLSFCMAVGSYGPLGDEDGYAVRWNGRSWSTPRKTGPTSNLIDSLFSVSCPSTTFCTAVGINGDALQWNGSSWSAPRRIDDAGIPGIARAAVTAQIASVSCASALLCIAVDDLGNAQRWRGP